MYIYSICSEVVSFEKQNLIATLKMSSVIIAIVLLALSTQCMGMLTKEQQEEIVNLHNQLRQRVAKGEVLNRRNEPEPAAANMSK